MSERTAIEWCDATLNLWWGCTKVSEGCKHCYADSLSNRYGRAEWGPKGTRVEVKGWRSTLNKISKRAKDEGRRLKVFCQSMSDTFEGPETCGGIESENWKTMQRLRNELWSAIWEHKELDFLLLTKRPENIEFCIRGLSDNFAVGFGDNVWLGTSVEDQATADKRIPELLKIPAAVRFASCEPLLGPVRFSEVPGFNKCGGAGQDLIRNFWVICGGESGPKARPMHPDWARSLRDQCQTAGVPFFFKQWGEWCQVNQLPDAGMIAGEEMTIDVRTQRVGKKAAGNLLDGREWKEFPRGGQ